MLHFLITKYFVLLKQLLTRVNYSAFLAQIRTVFIIFIKGCNLVGLESESLVTFGFPVVP